MKPKNALTKQYEKLFDLDGVKLQFERAALKEVVALAMKRGTGARALRSVLEDIMLDIMYSLPSKKDVVECRITREVVAERNEPTYYTKVRKTA